MDTASIYSEAGRGDLRHLNRDAIRAHVRRALTAFPDVAGAYLFGSALHLVGGRSDIDLGVIPAGEAGADRDAELAEQLESVLGQLGPHAFHVTVLRAHDNAFTFSVLNRGELIFVADENLVTDLIERVGREHDDLVPFRSTFYAALGMGV